MRSPEDEVREQLHHAQVENARLRGEIEAMRQSPSWRITKPIRGFKKIFKRPGVRA